MGHLINATAMRVGDFQIEQILDFQIMFIIRNFYL